MSLHRFSFPTAITFGAGARKEVAAHLTTLRIKRPLIVTDKGVAPLPFMSEFTQRLRDAFGPVTVERLFEGARGAEAAAGLAEGRPVWERCVRLVAAASPDAPTASPAVTLGCGRVSPNPARRRGG